jgi:recombination protein RecA
MEQNLHNYPGSVHIADSFTMLATKNEMDSGMDEMQRTETQRLLAKFFRRVKDVISVNRCLLIGITQLMGNPTPYGGPQEKGGMTLKYAVSNKIRAKKVKEIKVDGIQVGQEVTWDIETSAIGPPGQTVVSKIRYGEGLDKVGELIDLGVDLAIIQRAKNGWYTFMVDGKEEKMHGDENARAFLLEKPELQKAYFNQVKEMLGI